jgi:hypothetical protein
MDRFSMAMGITLLNRAALSVMTLTQVDALLNSLLDPLEGLSMVNCGKLELGGAPDFQH